MPVVQPRSNLLTIEEGGSIGMKKVRDILLTEHL
jgi:hypothetical protein